MLENKLIDGEWDQSHHPGALDGLGDDALVLDAGAGSAAGEDFRVGRHELLH